MSNISLIKTRYHDSYLSFVIVLGAVNTFYLHIIIHYLIVTFSYYVLLAVNTKILQLLRSYSAKFTKFVLYIISITHCFMTINIISIYNMNIFKSFMVVIAIILLFQALSVNFDYILIERANLSILDLYILGALTIAIYYSFKNFISIHQHVITLVILMLSLVMFLVLNQVLESYPISSLLIPTLLYLISKNELFHYLAYLYAMSISKLYGYAKSIDKMPILTPYYDNFSIIFVIIIISSTTILCTLLSSNIFLVITLIMYYIILLIVNIYIIIRIMMHYFVKQQIQYAK